MNNYEIINIKAEHIALDIYKITKEIPSSIISLVKWVEEAFDVKIGSISYTANLSNGHSGLVYFDPATQTYKIWLNAKEPEFRQRFTLCHEIAHIIRNKDLKYGLSDGDIYSKWGEERFCNRFAAAYLMPAELFIQKWRTVKEPIFLKKARLSSLFKVSGEAVYIRAQELKLV
ncbi:MAG TPA: ImmA/IrrE family metallo-endopeptidase [Candidatus Moranbacteria bacterium]|nr:ImmA/IrrE family metallo-endopeptidase [Candidatus Moranbacteria bacterium]